MVEFLLPGMLTEIITDAIVLDKEDFREQDSRIHLYTKNLGRVVAKTVSSRKILSKLAAHLEPLNLITARLVSKGDAFYGHGFQLVDALSRDPAKIIKGDPQDLASAILVYGLISRSIPSGIPDGELWDFLQSIRSGTGRATLHQALHTLGFNAQFARCQLCDRTQPEYFAPGENFFICTACAFNSNQPDADFIRLAI